MYSESQSIYPVSQAGAHPSPYWLVRLCAQNVFSNSQMERLVGNLFSPEAIEDLARSARKPQPDPLIAACSDAVFAIGYYCASVTDNPRASATNESLLDSLRRLTGVLASYKSLWEVPSSLIKLQVCPNSNATTRCCAFPTAVLVHR